MDIGEQQRIIVVEPLETPREPAPRRTPEPAEPKRREKEPAST